jgi:hypothetical protein
MGRVVMAKKWIGFVKPNRSLLIVKGAQKLSRFEPVISNILYHGQKRKNFTFRLSFWGDIPIK